MISIIRRTITPLASFILIDVLNVNRYLGIFGLALETLDGNGNKDAEEQLELETKRKIGADDAGQRKKIKPSLDLADMEIESDDDDDVNPGVGQRLWNLNPDINFTENLEMKIQFSAPKKYIAPTESFEVDISKDVDLNNDFETEETASDTVFVSNVDVVKYPDQFESVTETVVIPNPEANNEDSTLPDVDNTNEPLHREIVISQDEAQIFQNRFGSSQDQDLSDTLRDMVNDLILPTIYDWVSLKIQGEVGTNNAEEKSINPNDLTIAQEKVENNVSEEYDITELIESINKVDAARTENIRGSFSGNKPINRKRKINDIESNAECMVIKSEETIEEADDTTCYLKDQTNVIIPNLQTIGIILDSDANVQNDTINKDDKENKVSLNKSGGSKEKGKNKNQVL